MGNNWEILNPLNLFLSKTQFWRYCFLKIYGRIGDSYFYGILKFLYCKLRLRMHRGLTIRFHFWLSNLERLHMAKKSFTHSETFACGNDEN